MYAVHCKEQGSIGAPVDSQLHPCSAAEAAATAQDAAREQHHQHRRNAVEQHVHDMIAVGLQATPFKVEASVGQHCKGAVGLVAFFARHESTPKIVLEELPEGCFAGIQVVIRKDASMVVEYEASIQGAPVAGEGDCNYQ